MTPDKNNSPSRPLHQGPEFVVEAGKLCRIRRDRGGESAEPLANFSARIIRERHQFGGSDHAIHFDIEVDLDGAVQVVSISPSEFAATTWVSRYLGARAIVYGGPYAADHLRAAIQTNSTDIEMSATTDAMGWFILNDRVVFIQNGETILGQKFSTNPELVDAGFCTTLEAVKQVCGTRTLRTVNLPGINPLRVRAALPGNLCYLQLPSPIYAAGGQESVRAVLRLRHLAPRHITAPLLAAVFASPLVTKSSPLFLHGPSETFKSEVATIAQQFFGRDFTRKRLPCDFYTTANAREMLLHLTGDVLTVVDDYVPWATDGDEMSTQRAAARAIRSAVNGSSRLRLSGQGVLQESHPTRGVVIFTGEALPEGHSIQNRMVPVPFNKGDVNLEALSDVQRTAAEGCFAQAMSNYIAWIAIGFTDRQKAAIESMHYYRQELLACGISPRLSEGYAALYAGAESFYRFAVDSGAVLHEEGDELFEKWLAGGIYEACQLATTGLTERHPADVLIHLLQHLLAAGLAHVEARSGNAPDNLQSSWGWRRIWDQEKEDYRWSSNGPRIGWLDEEVLYLSGPLALREIRRIASASGQQLPVNEQNMGRVLFERGLIAHHEQQRDGYRCRPRIDGTQKTYYAIKAEPFLVPLPINPEWGPGDYDRIIDA